LPGKSAPWAMFENVKRVAPRRAGQFAWPCDRDGKLFTSSILSGSGVSIGCCRPAPMRSSPTRRWSRVFRFHAFGVSPPWWWFQVQHRVSQRRKWSRSVRSICPTHSVRTPAHCMN